MGINKFSVTKKLIKTACAEDMIYLSCIAAPPEYETLQAQHEPKIIETFS